MSHENSQTLQPGDRAYNVRGGTVQPLLPQFSFERTSYPTLAEGAQAAELRSLLTGVNPLARLLAGGPAFATPQAGGQPHQVPTLLGAATGQRFISVPFGRQPTALLNLAPVPSIPNIIREAMYRHPTAESAWRSVQAMRHRDPRNLDLRDAEHALYAQHIRELLGPVVGPATLLTSVPTYSATKALAQGLPPSWGRILDRLMPFEFSQSTRPDFSEIMWGLAPLWGGIPQRPPMR